MFVLMNIIALPNFRLIVPIGVADSSGMSRSSLFISRQPTVPQLLSSPTFNRMVRGVHKKVHDMRHGPNLEDMGGTKIDGQWARSILSSVDSLLTAIHR